MPVFDVVTDDMAPGDIKPMRFITGAPFWTISPDQETLTLPAGPGTYVFSILLNWAVSSIGTPPGTLIGEIYLNGILFPALSCEVDLTQKPALGFRTGPDMGQRLETDPCVAYDPVACDGSNIVSGVTTVLIPWDFSPGPFSVTGRFTNNSTGNLFFCGGQLQVGAGCGGSFPVFPPTSSVVTQASYTGGLLQDVATLSGTFRGTPTGTMVFRLYGPSSTLLSTESVAVSGTGVYNSTPTAPSDGNGIYRYEADFMGVGWNIDGDSDPADPNEYVTVGGRRYRPQATLIGAT